MASLKLSNLAVHNPITGVYGLDPTFKGCTYLPQIRKWTFPLNFYMGKDTRYVQGQIFNSYLIFFVLVSQVSKYSEKENP